MSTIVWFRSDLRLADNPALAAAVERGPVIPVFLWPPEETHWAPGAASRWWLHHSLVALAASLQERGSRLILHEGPAAAALRAIAKSTGATAVFWNRRWEPEGVEADQTVRWSLEGANIEARSFNAALLREPAEIFTKTGKPYQVFTPFSRAHMALPPTAAPTPAPKTILSPDRWPASLTIDELKLLSILPWADGFAKVWTPGEGGAQSSLGHFIHRALDDYDKGRDRPAEAGTSRLSPHLHFGEIGPRQIFAALDKASHRHPAGTASMKRYRLEILWREFAHHLLHHFPRTPDHPLRPNFEKFPWKKPGTSLKVWQKGLTGYPIVDAGMRELWSTGWMHNRVRMIVSSFLVKDLGLDWRRGAEWFWDTLVDADLANNTLGWQWSAGCGADAAPFFRIFNPVLQGEKFDAAGIYVRRWVPELKDVPAKWIHKPWQARREILAAANVTLGKTYPAPIVDHGQARDAALAAFRKIRKAKT